MQLSPEYYRVRAILQEPAQVILKERRYTVHADFRVGFAEYRATFTGSSPSPRRGDEYSVDFYLLNLHGSNRELQEYFSRIFKRPIKIEQVPDIKEQMLSHATGILKLGNVGQVFGAMITTIRNFAEKYHPSQILFSATGESRVSLYKKIISRYLPDGKIDITGGKDSAVFRISFPQRD
jgi:hypothetical protein